MQALWGLPFFRNFRTHFSAAVMDNVRDRVAAPEARWALVAQQARHAMQWHSTARFGTAASPLDQLGICLAFESERVFWYPSATR